MPQGRNSSFGIKSDRVGKMVRLLEDDDRFASGCQYGHSRAASRSPNIYFDMLGSPQNNSGPSNRSECSASSSSLPALDQSRILDSLQNIVVGSSDESGSESDVDSGSKLEPDSHGLRKTREWNNPSVSSLVDQVDGSKNDALTSKSRVSSRFRGRNKHTLSWQDRYMVQPPKLHDSVAKNIGVGDMQRGSIFYQTQRAYRKGSSSKAPQTNDLTAPLLFEKKSRPISERSLQGESEEHGFISMDPLGSKIRNTSGRRTSRSSSSATEASNRRRGNSHNSHGHHIKPEEMGAGRKDMNMNGAASGRRGLSNLVCASAADVLPSLSSSGLSNLTCSSTVDVLPSVPSAMNGSTFRPRRSSRAVGLEGETSRRLQSLKQQVQESDSVSMRELHSGVSLVSYGSGEGESQVGYTLYGNLSQPKPLSPDFVPCEALITSLTPPSLPPNHRQWARTVALSGGGDGLRSVYRTSSPFFEANSTFGEDSQNHWSLRRRSLNVIRTDPVCPDSRPPSTSFSSGRPSGNTWSILREMHYPQSRFSGPPVRPPPRPPGSGFAESSSSESGFSPTLPASSAEYAYSSQSSAFEPPGANAEEHSGAELAEAGSASHIINNGESRPRLTVEGLSEILSALEYIERDEDLSYEQILMLEATLLLGGIGLHDRYRDMRIDIDNMSYEELLALEERIGNVNTGLSEESVRKSLRVETFSYPEVTHDYVPQEVEIKCSICQEEFDEAVELGVLDCGHSYHVACIKQWLLQKNQCPICKAPAIP